MSNKSPIFPMPEPQHFSDYGFDPQIDYFQVLQEARNHKKDSNTTSRPSIDSKNFKLQKPISRDDQNKKKKRWTWKNALIFLKLKWISVDNDVHVTKPRALPCPVYITESRSGSSTPCRTTSRPSSGPIAGTMTPTRKGDVGMPYLSLKELNMEEQEKIQQRMSTSSMPIYLVT